MIYIFKGKDTIICIFIPETYYSIKEKKKNRKKLHQE